MSLSVVIATRDRAVFLEHALESLALQVGAPEFEVIVVDNASSDHTALVVQERQSTEFPFPLKLLFVSEPNRGKARNVGIAAASREIIVFIDDDVWLPEGFLAAHAAAHDGTRMCVSGPILNVPSYEDRPKPGLAHYSGAFLCTCNASIPREVLLDVGGFDEGFHLYGWEDTDLGLRLRHTGVRRFFAWGAYLYHIKSPTSETVEIILRKTLEKARMAVLLLEKNPGIRARLATGAYEPNFLRACLSVPECLLPLYAGLAQDDRIPKFVRGLARTQLLDGVYTHALRRTLRARTPKK
jgi:GT2 family glycosyltransferase